MSSMVGDRTLVHAFGPSFTQRLAQQVVRVIDELAHRRELRRSRFMLGQLDDRLLRDVGLDRATAKNESGKGFWA